MNPSKKSEKSKIKNQNSNNGLNNWIGIIAILILGFIIYGNTFNCAFQFDDKHNIVDFDGIRDLGNLKPMWEVNHSRFLSFLSFAINYHYGQLNVGGYHFVNLCIHLLNACLVFWIIRLLFTTPALKNNNVAIHKSSIALVGALMFVSHPLATGAVTYIVQRMASMVATFYFLSIAL